ncbi:16033_t:CDS:2, partial [Gigaspora margarita]
MYLLNLYYIWKAESEIAKNNNNSLGQCNLEKIYLNGIRNLLKMAAMIK